MAKQSSRNLKAEAPGRASNTGETFRSECISHCRSAGVGPGQLVLTERGRLGYHSPAPKCKMHAAWRAQARPAIQAGPSYKAIAAPWTSTSSSGQNAWHRFDSEKVEVSCPPDFDSRTTQFGAVAPLPLKSLLTSEISAKVSRKMSRNVLLQLFPQKLHTDTVTIAKRFPPEHIPQSPKPKPFTKTRTQGFKLAQNTCTTLQSSEDGARQHLPEARSHHIIASQPPVVSRWCLCP